MKFSIKHFFRKCDQIHRKLTFTDEILNGKFHFLCSILFQWFSDNQMKGNEGNCHVLVNTKEKVCVNIGTTQITNSKCEKLLGIKIDSNLNFEDDIGNICKKAGAKLNARTGIANHNAFLKKKGAHECFLYISI